MTAHRVTKRLGVTGIATVTALATALVSGQVPTLREAAATERAQSPTECVSGVLSDMSLAQRVGQLFIAGVNTEGPTSAQLKLIRSRSLGGAILMGHTDDGVAATAEVAERLQQQADDETTDGVKLWVAADQEGGNVQVLHGSGFSEMPTALTQGSWSADTVRSRAADWASQLLSAGVNMNLAPVLDTVPAELGTANKPIGYYDREYGHTPDAVRTHGMAFLRGMADSGVQATAKHFPGLGRVRDNTDTTHGVTDDVTTRHDSYLEPFEAAVDAGAPVVMVSLARYSKIDAGTVAAFSPTVLRGMLRDDLGYDGVIMSDSLSATAVRDVPVAERGVRFIAAGGTAALVTQADQAATMVDTALGKARNDADFRDRVDTAARRVLRAKWRAGLVPCPPASDPIATHYKSLGGLDSYLGEPEGGEYSVADGRARDYAGGSIFWSTSTGAYAMRGANLAHYRHRGGPDGLLGFPTTDERATPDGHGAYNHLDGSGGAALYWTRETGSHEVHGGIQNKWAELGWERSPLGYPVTDERGAPDGVGRYNHFEGAGGSSIYWTPRTGAHAVRGAVRNRWESLGWQSSQLRYPVTDERGTPDGVGRYNHFEGTGGSSIYWTPKTGAWAVLGKIRDRWASLGWEQSRLGYPVSNEYDVTGGRRSDFQHGSIVWDRSSNTTRVIYR